MAAQSMKYYRKCEICGIKSERTNGQKRLFMARFPSDEPRCQEWVKVTGKEDLAHMSAKKLHQLKFVCGKHFQHDDFNEKKTRLRRTAVPSLHLTQESGDKPITRRIQPRKMLRVIETRRKSFEEIEPARQPLASYIMSCRPKNPRFSNVNVTKIKKYCKVKGCLTSNHTHPQLAFFHFPTDKKRNEQWINLVGCGPLSKSGYNRDFVCQLHFEPKYMRCHSFHKTLNKFCVPTLNLPSPLRDRGTQVEPADVRNPQKVVTENNHTQKSNSSEQSKVDIDLENSDVEALRKEFHELCDCFLPAELAQEVKSVTSGPIISPKEDIEEPSIFDDRCDTKIVIKVEPFFSLTE